MARVPLKIKIERKGRIHNSSLRIAKTNLFPIDGQANVNAEPGKSYWLYFFIEGHTGASAELVITDLSGKELLKIEHDKMKIPPALGRNGGSFKFDVPTEAKA